MLVFLAAKAQYIDSLQFNPHTYHKAYQAISQMVEGKQEASFKKAVFLAENAYYGNQLDPLHYNLTIQGLASIVEQLEENADSSFQYSEKDRANVLKNYALFSLFTDTLTINGGIKALPPAYNHTDPFGTDEWGNTLVMNLMASNQGTCRSLSYLYKILADETGAPAYLSLAPNHVYLQHPSKKTNWYNTELTSGQIIDDAWLMAAGYIDFAAIQNRLYMDTLSPQQSVALCLLDLAQGYRQQALKTQSKLTSSDWVFIQQCAEKVQEGWENCPNALLLEIEALTALHKLGNEEAYAKLEAAAKKLHLLGYRRMPEGMYFETAEATDKYDRDHKGIYYSQNQKEGGRATSTKEILTLSEGRYKEFHIKQKLERIADIWFDTEKLEIHSLIEEEDERKRIPSLTSRWLSLDPLQDKYPDLSPYNFVANSPIRFLDPDGRIIVDANGNVIYTTSKKPNGLIRDIAPEAYDEATNTVTRFILKYETIYIFANDGTPIEATLLRGVEMSVRDVDDPIAVPVTKMLTEMELKQYDWASEYVKDPSTLVANCHGLSFANSQIRIGDLMVDKLIAGDKLKKVSEKNGEILVSYSETLDKEHPIQISHSIIKNKDNTYTTNGGDDETINNVSLEAAQRGISFMYYDYYRQKKNKKNRQLPKVDYENKMRELTENEKIKLEKNGTIQKTNDIN